jgi:hypothetical protein
MDKIWSLFSGNSNILKFLLSPVRFTKCLGVRVPLHPPRKKALHISIITVVPHYQLGSFAYSGFRLFLRFNVVNGSVKDVAQVCEI